MPALIARTQLPTAAPLSPSDAHAADIRMDLQKREGTLTTEVARMEGQRLVLVKQIRDAGDSWFVIANQQSLGQLEVQLAGSKAELDAVRSQLAKMSVPDVQETFTTLPPVHFDDPSFLGRIDPDAITAVFVMLAVGLIVPLSLGLARRFTRRPVVAPSVAPEIVMARLDRVDQALDAIAIEMERVAESQRFMAKMMAENAVKPVDAQAHGLDEAKPRLALGAGPVEPIRVAERQAVKQSITPH